MLMKHQTTNLVRYYTNSMPLVKVSWWNPWLNQIVMIVLPPEQSRDSFRVTQQMGRDYSERDATTVKRTRLQLKGTWPSRSHTRTTRSQWLRVTFRPSRCRLLLQKSQAKIVAFCRTSAQEIWLEINDWCDSTHAHINDLFRYSRYRQIKQGNLHF